MMLSPINYSTYQYKQPTRLNTSFRGVTQTGEKITKTPTLKNSKFVNIFKRITKPKTREQKECLNQYYDSLAIFTKGEDQQKVLKFLNDNIEKVQDNRLIHFCILNAIDKDEKINFEGFRQLYETSEAIYEMIGDLYCCERDKKIINNEILPKFAHNKLKDYIDVVKEFRLEDGTFDKKQMKKFQNNCKCAHGFVEALYSGRNADGSINWEAQPYLKTTNRIIRDGLYKTENYKNGLEKDKNYNDAFVIQILQSLSMACEDRSGKIDCTKLKNLNKELEKELELNSIQENPTLGKILPCKLLSYIGMYDTEVDKPSEALAIKSNLMETFKPNPNMKENILAHIMDNRVVAHEIFNFLCQITASEEYRYMFVEEFSRNPMYAEDLKIFLINKLGGQNGGKELFNKWYYDENVGYVAAYKDWYNNKFLPNCKTLDDVVKQSPNITPWFIQEFSEQTGCKKTLGELPKDFDEKTFNELTKALRDKIKTYEQGKTYDVKLPNDNFDLEVNGKSFHIETLGDGNSLQGKFKITENIKDTPSYVIKLARHKIQGNTLRSNKFNESETLLPDSPFTNSLIGFYLKYNHCPNTPDIRYYDWENQAVVYGFTEGENPVFEDKYKYNIYEFQNMHELNYIKELGLIINDINPKNFILDANGTLKIIDTGHIQYKHAFRPNVEGIHMDLGNHTGRNI